MSKNWPSEHAKPNQQVSSSPQPALQLLVPPTLVLPTHTISLFRLPQPLAGHHYPRRLSMQNTMTKMARQSEYTLRTALSTLIPMVTRFPIDKVFQRWEVEVQPISFLSNGSHLPTRKTGYQRWPHSLGEARPPEHLIRRDKTYSNLVPPPPDPHVPLTSTSVSIRQALLTQAFWNLPTPTLTATLTSLVTPPLHPTFPVNPISILMRQRLLLRSKFKLEGCSKRRWCNLEGRMRR